MELDQKFPDSAATTSSTASTEADPRVAVFLGEAELSPPDRITALAEISIPDFQPGLESNSSAARDLLVQYRVSQPGYRPPETKTRNKFIVAFRSDERHDEIFNEQKWIFTKHEVAKTFDTLVHHTPLAPPGTAQALLTHAGPDTSLEELWYHFHDPKLEKRMKSRFRRSRSSIVPYISWLDEVTSQDDLDYVCLMCQVGIGQEALDQAFSIALSKHSMDIMKALLSFGAVASGCQDAIRERVRLRDVDLTKLLLSAPPNAMSLAAWRHCMEVQVKSSEKESGKESPLLLLLCLAHRPLVVCGPLLLKALSSRNFQATAIILAYANGDEEFLGVHKAACGLATQIQDDGLRYKFFNMLAKSAFVTDTPDLRQELMKDVKDRHLPLVQLLTNMGISLDIEPFHALNWAVSHMDLAVLGLFKNGKFSSPVSPALSLVPDKTSESDMLLLVDIFAHIGLVVGDPLHAHLVRAVRKQHARLVQKLLQHGASVEFKQASAINAALSKPDFKILGILLKNDCSPEILSVTVPTAMALQPRPSRLRAVQALVKKGVLKTELGIPLQSLVAEDGEADGELIQLLLQHGAPIDGVGDDANNAVLVTASKCNLLVLRMLCDAKPKAKTLSRAVPVAFDAVQTHGYQQAQDCIELLLRSGANGIPIHLTLLTAARQDYRLDIVRHLVSCGAEANYANGASFSVALETRNFKLLEILCAGCPPSQASTESVLSMATNPECFDLQALTLLLASMSATSAARALNASWASEKFKGNPNMTAILPCFLRFGLDVDLGNGELLCFAIQEQNIDLLTRILSANPSSASLTAAFPSATIVQPSDVALEMMRVLLEKAVSVEIGQSNALALQIPAALAGDFAGLLLLLNHHADVNFDDGRAIQAAATAGSLRTLDELLTYRPAPFTLNRACLAAAASSMISQSEKQSVFERLLNANGGVLARADDISTLLADSVAGLPIYIQLPRLLLERGAEVKFETLLVAVKTSSREVFLALANSILSANTVSKLFREARKASLIPARRYWIYEYLLGRGIPTDDISEALLDSLQAVDLADLSLPQLLLQRGAAVGYKKGTPFKLALKSNSIDAMQLLGQFLPDDSTANEAFGSAIVAAPLDRHVRLGVYRLLLHWNIKKGEINRALRMNVENRDQSDAAIVQLLLANGADPNLKSAYCFVLAVKADAEAEFRALSKHADLPVVLTVLIHHFKQEWQVVWWFTCCLEEQPLSAEINDQDGQLLFRCLRKFPRGTALLRLLLDNGVSTSACVAHPICEGWPAEKCTALIWSLFSTKPRIDNEVILTILEKGGDDALPTFATDQTKVSASLGCLLDKTRTPVLKALLDWDKDAVLDYLVPESSIVHLGAYPKALDEETPSPLVNQELPLRLASLYLGNFDAYRLATAGEDMDDALLHSTALLALPKFVKWLLDSGLDPNTKVPDFETMIPLALACKSQPRSWCKIADEEADWRSRQKDTMKLLAPRTSLKWRSGQQTVLHVALHNGLETTRALIEVLDIKKDPERNERYLFVDKDRRGIEYSPDQWVWWLRPDLNEQDKLALISCLQHEAKLKSRYFRRLMPGEGEQPKYYCGLPSPFAAAWEAHDNLPPVIIRTVPEP